MQKSDINIGQRVKVNRRFVSVDEGQWVKVNRRFVGVDEGTEGVIIEDYGTGITVAWDMPNQPYPSGKTPQQVAEMMAVNPQCPLRDGFDKVSELKYLEVADAD